VPAGAFFLAVCGRCRSWAIVAPFGHHCPGLVVGTHEQTSSARHVRAFFSSENNGALTELRRHRSSHGTNEPVRFEMRLPPALRAELTRAAAVENRSAANMPWHLIARGLLPQAYLEAPSGVRRCRFRTGGRSTQRQTSLWRKCETVPRPAIFQQRPARVKKKAPNVNPGPGWP
jgi:hypothetical protein